MKTMVRIILTVCIVAFTYGFAQAESVTATFEVYDATGVFLGYSSSGPDYQSSTLPPIFLPSISKFCFPFPDGSMVGPGEVYYKTTDCAGSDMYHRGQVSYMDDYYVYSWDNKSYLMSPVETSETVYSRKKCLPPPFGCECHSIGEPWTFDFHKLEPITLPFSVPLALPLKYKLAGKPRPK